MHSRAFMMTPLNAELIARSVQLGDGTAGERQVVEVARHFAYLFGDPV